MTTRIRNTPTQSREDKAHKSSRPAQVPIGQGQKLKIAQRFVEKGYHYHWFLDRQGELEAAQAAWYEFVKDEKGEKVTVPAGKGDTHYLMRIDQQYYDEDMAKQQDMVTETTRRRIEVNRNAGEYSPEKAETAVIKDREYK